LVSVLRQQTGGRQTANAAARNQYG